MTVKKAWREFTKNLAACIGALAEDEYLIIARTEANQFVQFAGLGAYGVRSEATGNGYIEPPELLLDQRQYARMHRLGWMRPAALPGEPIAGGSPNFHVDGANTEQACREMAKRATRTFRRVYRVEHPGMLNYEAFHCEGTSIRFPTLLIKRRVTEPVFRIGEMALDADDGVEMNFGGDGELDAE